jgi:hypothetical protein
MPYYPGMRLLVIAGAIVLLASSGYAGVKRSKIECSKASLTPLKPGWGQIPPALQKLPPGASLCGMSGAGVAIILSDLEAPALQKFYAPLFAQVGCKSLTCKTDQFKQQVCECPKAGLVDTGYVSLARYDQMYQLFYAAP